MCVDGLGFAIAFVALSFAATTIAKMYFDYKKGNKNG